ncbi:MAG: hypothetical protein K9M10_02135 [Candidatus Pacebacteria bacterium]|nr:hypothetical protein [Candidatus Paceibacterota bacterium]MCF7857263.1 hypothetical protein [Candidatus Paceibacterota bacterium]
MVPHEVNFFSRSILINNVACVLVIPESNLIDLNAFLSYLESLKYFPFQSGDLENFTSRLMPLLSNDLDYVSLVQYVDGVEGMLQISTLGKDGETPIPEAWCTELLLDCNGRQGFVFVEKERRQ